MKTRFVRWLAARPVRAAGLVATLAAVAVLAKFFMTAIATKGEWHWLDLTTGSLDNVLIAGLIAVAGAVIEFRRRADDERARALRIDRQQRVEVRTILDAAGVIASGWSPIPKSERNDGAPLGQDLQSAAQEMTAFAEELDAFHSRQAEPAGLFVEVIQLPSSIERYLLEGGRRRRFLVLELLYRDLAPLLREAIDDDLREKVKRVRVRLLAALLLRSHADTVVLERLAVERVFRPFGLTSLDAEHRQRLEDSAVPDAAVIHEPLYQLVAYVRMNMSDVTNLTAEDLDGRFDTIRRCVGALRNEVFGIAEAMMSLWDLVVEVTGPDEVPVSHAA